MPISAANVVTLKDSNNRGIQHFVRPGNHVIVDPAGSAFMSGTANKRLDACGASGASGGIYANLYRYTEPTGDLRPKTKKELTTSEAVLNDNDDLQRVNLSVIHAIGPQGSSATFAADLKTTFTNIINAWTTGNAKAKTLVIPFISGGAFGGTSLQNYYDIFLQSLDSAIAQSNLAETDQGRIKIVPSQPTEHQSFLAAINNRDKKKSVKPTAAPQPPIPASPGSALDLNGLHDFFKTSTHAATSFEELSDHMPVSAAFKLDGSDAFKVTSLNVMDRAEDTNQDLNRNTKLKRHINNRLANNPWNIWESKEQHEARFILQLTELLKRGDDFILLQEANLLYDKLLSQKLEAALAKARSKGYEFAFEENTNPASAKQSKQLVTLYNKNRYTAEKTLCVVEIKKTDSDNQSKYQQPRAMVAVFQDKVSPAKKIAIGNMHLEFGKDDFQLGELQKLHGEYSRKDIPLIFAGDANIAATVAKTKNHSALLAINGATAHESVDKQKRILANSSDKDNSNEGIHTNQTVKHTNGTLRTEDWFSVSAGSENVEVTLLAGKSVTVDAGGALVYNDYPNLPPHTVVTATPAVAPSAPSPSAVPISAARAIDSKVVCDQIVQIMADAPTVAVPVVEAFHASLKTQEAEIKPKKVYRGLGIEGRPIEMDNGKVGIAIDEIFAPGFARFYTSTPGDLVNQSELLNRFITAIQVGTSSLTIDDLASRHGGRTSPTFLKELASLFHSEGKISFQTTDVNGGNSKNYSCNRDDKTIFVTKDCAHASLALNAANVHGDQYNSAKYDAHAFKNYDTIAAAATNAAHANAPTT